MKEGLTSEEYLNKLDKTKWADMLKVAMEVRQFEISLYWKRANYFLAVRFFVLYRLLSHSLSGVLFLDKYRRESAFCCRGLHFVAWLVLCQQG